MIVIRPEQPEDIQAIWRVNEAAFRRENMVEADLVDALRESGAVALSLVAEVEGELVGHILFTPITIEGEDETYTAVALGPLGVLPTHQNKGIGSRLVTAALEALREAGRPHCGAEIPFSEVTAALEALREAGQGVVIVLGHAGYYPRFGFVPASRHGIRWDRDVPDDVFMVVELLPGALDGVEGVVHYQPEFDAV